MQRANSEIMIIDHQSRLLQVPGGEINATPVPLRRNVLSSPWCYAVSLIPPILVDGDGGGDDDDEHDSNTPKPASTGALPPGANFLATQVWPSSRIASKVIEKCIDPSWTICELGCGPGLPSLTAARAGAKRVIATDVDSLALELVQAAAIEQGLIDNDNGGYGLDYLRDVNRREQRLTTRKFDLTSQENQLPRADLYILSDVFESTAVAEGAAWHIQTVFSQNRRLLSENYCQQKKDRSLSRVWVFAQSDRAQRDSFLVKMKEWYKNNDDKRRPILDWTMNHTPDHNSELWLFDLDETMVDYN